MAGLPAGGRGHAQHRARVGRQRLQAQGEDVAQAGRQRARRAVRRGQQLLGEEGVALAARMQSRHELGLGAGAEDPRDLDGELPGEKGSTSRRSTPARRSSSARKGRSGWRRCSSSLR